MKLRVVCCVSFVLYCSSFAQKKYETREEKLEQLKTRSDIKVTEVEKDILKLEFLCGKVIYKNIGEYKPVNERKINYSPTYDSTISVDQRFLILKFTGSPNQHSYELYYIKKNEIASNYNVYYGASIYDVTGDSNEEILISRQQSNNGIRLFTSIYRPTTIVPVELISFTAIASDNNVLLKWSTASELNNKGFEIERLQDSKITRLQNWEVICFVEGYGTTSEQQNYSYKDSNLTSGKYAYRLKQIDYDGSFRYSQEIEVNLSSPLRYSSYSLYQNYPNPFNPTTEINYYIKEDGLVTLRVFDVLGNEIATLVNEFQQAGYKEVKFDAATLTSGVYIYRLAAGNYISTKKMMVVK